MAAKICAMPAFCWPTAAAIWRAEAEFSFTMAESSARFCPEARTS